MTRWDPWLEQVSRVGRWWKKKRRKDNEEAKGKRGKGISRRDGDQDGELVER